MNAHLLFPRALWGLSICSSGRPHSDIGYPRYHELTKERTPTYHQGDGALRWSCLLGRLQRSVEQFDKARYGVRWLLKREVNRRRNAVLDHDGEWTSHEGEPRECEAPHAVCCDDRCLGRFYRLHHLGNAAWFRGPELSHWAAVHKHSKGKSPTGRHSDDPKPHQR